MNLAEALSYIQNTIQNHLTGQMESLVVTYQGPTLSYSAMLREPGALDPHAEIHNAPSMEDAIIRLAHAIREDSNIGA